MDDSSEVGTGMLDELPGEVREQLIRDIGRFAIALFAAVSDPREGPELLFIGSGTVVEVATFHCILTAAHVWARLRKFPYLALTLKEGEDHCFLIQTSTIVDTTLGLANPRSGGRT